MTDLLSLWPLIPPAILLLAWLVRAEDRSRKNEVAVQVSKTVAERAMTELSAFREKVAGEYATLEVLNRIEERISAEFRRLGDRFDRWLEGHGGRT